MRSERWQRRADDDSLFPDHVERMLALLNEADVAMPLGSNLLPNGVVEAFPWALEDEPGRSMARSGVSLFSLTGLSHSMSGGAVSQH